MTFPPTAVPLRVIKTGQGTLAPVTATEFQNVLQIGLVPLDLMMPWLSLLGMIGALLICRRT